MDYEKLKEVIAKQIKENGQREITGPVLQAVLMAMVDSLGEVYSHTYTDEEKAQARANIDALSNHNGEITKEKLSIEVQAILNDVANKQNITDESLATIAKTIVGAINEVYKGGLKDASITTDKLSSEAYDSTPTENSDKIIKSGFHFLTEKSSAFSNSEGLPMVNIEGSSAETVDAITSKVLSEILLDLKVISGGSTRNYEYGIGGLQCCLNWDSTNNNGIWIARRGIGSDTWNKNWKFQTLGTTKNYGVHNKTVEDLSSGDKIIFSVNWAPTILFAPSTSIGIYYFVDNYNWNQDYIFNLEIGPMYDAKILVDAYNNSNAAIDGIIEGIDKKTYEIPGEIDYYSEYGSGYSNSIMTGQRTGAFTENVRFNKVLIGPVKLSSNNAATYYIFKYIGDYLLSSNRTILKTGTLNLTTQFTQYEIDLGNVVTVNAGYGVGVVIMAGYNGVTFLGRSSKTTPPAYPSSAPLHVIFSLTRGTPEEVYNSTWYNGSAGFDAVQPVLKLKSTQITKENVEEIVEEKIETEMPTITENVSEALGLSVDVILPNKIYAVVGDTLQLFYRGIVKAVDPYNYDIVVTCSKGNAYPRYWQYKPRLSDIGETTLTITIKNQGGVILGTAQTTIKTVSAPSSPITEKKIFIFGDSLTSAGIWCGEANRRLTNTNSIDNIQGKGLTNISFCGSKLNTQNDTNTPYFGVGGWTWANYISAGSPQFRAYVSGVTSLSIGAKYSNNGNTYTISEVNVTAGSGNILLTGSSSAPQSSGVLTKVSGDGDATINFSSYERESSNPLWDVENNKMSFIPYVTAQGGGQIDAVYVLLTWNGQSSWANYDGNSESGQIGYAKTFARKLHEEYPNAKLKIMGIQMPSCNGGLGSNYGATGGYVDRFGLYHCAFSYNKALQDMCNLDEFSSYCEFIATAPQFDSENNMPESNVKVNIRNEKTEERGTNGVHPAKQGYYQIGDVVYRNIVAEFCQ